MKKLMMAFALLASVAIPAHAAPIATWDVGAGLFGTVSASGIVVNISGGGGGGTGVLDSNGTFSISGLNSLLLNLDAEGIIGGGNLNLAASGNITGTYNSATQQLSGNVATLNVSQNSPCSPFGFLGELVCDAIPGAIDFSNPFVLTAAQGLSDPFFFDLVNDTTILVGNLGGVVQLQLGLSNVQLSPVPVPAAGWLFGSALMGLIGVARKKRSVS